MLVEENIIASVLIVVLIILILYILGSGCHY